MISWLRLSIVSMRYSQYKATHCRLSLTASVNMIRGNKKSGKHFESFSNHNFI